MFLCNAEVGKEYMVSSLWLDKKIARRLETLGMTKGSRLLIMQKKGSGTMVVKVRGTRFALGGGITQAIALQSVEKGKECRTEKSPAAEKL